MTGLFRSLWRTAALAFLFGVGAGPGHAAETAPPPPKPAPITGAVLRGLDKTTARVTQFVAPIGQTVRFGTLEITVKDCRTRPPEESPESAAYFDIEELRPGTTVPEQLFSGWMFASSPSVSALQDPVYDVWLLSCTTATGSSGSTG